jgi:hypothetical protein
MILAIDPGTEKSAILEWDGRVLGNKAIVENRKVLMEIQRRPEVEIYCEWISSYGMRVGKEVFETCYWVGKFDQASVVSVFSRFHRVKRIDVKRFHTGRPSSKDADVRGALIEKYGPPGLKASPGLTYGLTKDLWQAFALATYVTEGGLHGGLA